MRSARIPGFADQTVSPEILTEICRCLGRHVEFADLPSELNHLPTDPSASDLP